MSAADTKLVIENLEKDKLVSSNDLLYIKIDNEKWSVNTKPLSDSLNLKYNNLIKKKKKN